MKIKKCIGTLVLIFMFLILIFFGFVLIETFHDKYDFSTRLICFAFFFVLLIISIIVMISIKRNKITKKMVNAKQYVFPFIEFNNIRNTIMYPTFKQSIFMIAILFVFQLCLALFFKLMANYFIEFENTTLTIGLTNLIVLSCGIYYYVKKNGSSIIKVASLNIFSVYYIVPIIIFTISITNILVIISSEFQRMVPIPEILESVLLNMTVKSENYFISILTLCIIAPLTEEILFRGVILHSFLNYFSIRKAVLLSSLLFSIIHLNPWQGIPTFFLGIYFAIIDIKLKSVIPSIIGHMIYNLSIFAIGIFEKSFSFHSSYIKLILISILFSIITVILFKTKSIKSKRYIQ
jgi:uncharacterized protein